MNECNKGDLANPPLAWRHAV